MIILHNAVVPFDDEPIVITDAKSIKIFTADHSTPMDCTRVVLDDGTNFLVEETVSDIIAMLSTEPSGGSNDV